MPVRATPRSVPDALRALRRRPDVRAAANVARRLGVSVRAVGGAVRGAFLGLSGGDLDLSVRAEHAAGFAGALAEDAGTRAIAIGAEGRRIWRVPWRAHEVDVWPAEGDAETDALRRDFTVNALSFELPGGTLRAPESALADLLARRLAPPRKGVFLEDPLRVLRAARFSVTLPGFRLDPRAVPEIREAAASLPRVAAERRLAELDLILAVHPRKAARALRDLERWGALAALMSGAASGERCRGIVRVGKAPVADVAVARTLLVESLGPERAPELLAEWKAPRVDIRLSRTLLTLPRKVSPLSQRAIVEAVRHLRGFARQGAVFLAAHPSRRALASKIAEIAASRRRLDRMITPRRPFSIEEIRTLTGLGDGPELGAALVALDLAIASGEVRGRLPAKRLLLGFRR